MSDGEFLLSVVQKFDLENGQWKELYNEVSKEMYLKMYEPRNSKKKYLFFWSKQAPINQLDMVDELIDEQLNYTIIPQDTNLILFSEVESLDEMHYKQIIEVEENEFRYKKYVCYYTLDELEALKNEVKEIFISEDNFFRAYPDFKRGDSFALLYRMIIKIPIIKLMFEKKELEEFQKLYEAEREATEIFTIEQIVEMENQIIPYIPNKEEFEEITKDLVDNLIGNIYGGELDEYLS